MIEWVRRHREGRVSAKWLTRRTSSTGAVRLMRGLIGAALLGVVSLAAAQSPAGAAGPAAVSPPDTLEQRLIGCTVCHGTQDVLVKGGYYPRLFGKPPGYLYNQLIDFREGRRAYPLMTYLVGHLPEPYLKEIADWFGSQHPPYPAPEPAQASAATLARGRQLVFEGDPARDLPACVACHGQQLTGVMPAIPGLLGLPRDYINAQFGAWRNRARRTIEPDCMAQITSRLSNDDIAAAAAWLAWQPVPGQGLPADQLATALPLRCGSVDPAAKVQP